MSGTTNDQTTSAAEATEQNTDTAAQSEQSAEPTASTASAVGNVNPLVAYLQDKVTSQEAQLRDAAIAANAAQAQIAAIPALRVIAEASLNQMRIALGHTATDAAALSPDALVAEHQRVSAEFGAKFPVGGVAASSSGAEVHKPTAAQVDPTHLARVQATRIN